jgi:type IV pilus biogenesis protein CpaD/CtpE
MRNAILIIALAAGLTACAMNNKPLEPNFGQALRQNLNAQVADPDARYARVIQPASDGVRTSAAQVRYQTGEVIEPARVSTSSIRSSGGGSDGGSGGGSGGSK